MDSMDELEKRAVRRGVVVGALGMLLVCLLAGWRLLPGYGNHLMTMLKLPSAPFILTIVLGSSIESYLRRGCNMDPRGWVSFFTHPVSLVLLIVAAASVVWSLLGGKLKRHGEKEA